MHTHACPHRDILDILTHIHTRYMHLHTQIRFNPKMQEYSFVTAAHTLLAQTPSALHACPSRRCPGRAPLSGPRCSSAPPCREGLGAPGAAAHPDTDPRAIGSLSRVLAAARGLPPTPRPRVPHLDSCTASRGLPSRSGFSLSTDAAQFWEGKTGANSLKQNCK